MRLFFHIIKEILLQCAFCDKHTCNWWTLVKLQASKFNLHNSSFHRGLACCRQVLGPGYTKSSAGPGIYQVKCCARPRDIPSQGLGPGYNKYFYLSFYIYSLPLSISISFVLSFSWSLSLSLCVSLCLSVCPSLSVHLSVGLSVPLALCPSSSLSLFLSLYLT